MNVDRARRLVAALPISADERDEILACLASNDDVHADAYSWRLYWQQIHGWDRADAIKEAIKSHRPFVGDDGLDGLRKSVRHPNGRVRMLAKEKRDSGVALRNIFDETTPKLNPKSNT